MSSIGIDEICEGAMQMTKTGKFNVIIHSLHLSYNIAHHRYSENVC